MWPILPFFAGIAVGASALGLARKTLPRARTVAQSAREKIRQATVSGLDNIQQSSKLWRDRLSEKTNETPCPCATAQKDES